MAGVGGRAAAHLSRHLARLRLLQGARLPQAHAAALLHTTPALDAGIFEWGEEDEAGSFVEDLFEGLTEMAAHYNPTVEESPHPPPPGHHREALIVKEREARRDKHGGGVSVAPRDSLPVTPSVTSEDEQVSVSEERRAMTVHSSLGPLYKGMNYETVTSSLHAHEEEVVQMPIDLESVGEQLPSPDDLPAASDHVHSLDERQLRVEFIEAISTKPHPTELEQMQKDRIERDDSDITGESLGTDLFPGDMPEEGVCAVTSPEGGGDSRGTPAPSAAPEVPNDSKDVKVGTLIALMVAEGEDWKSVEMPSSAEGDAPTPSPAAAAADTAAKAPAGGDGGHGNYGPSVRLLLEQYGLRADDVPPGGPHGILVKGDVLRFVKERNLQARTPAPVPPPEAPKAAAAASPTTAAAPPKPPPPTPTPGVGGQSGYIDSEVTSMRRTIAKRLTQSKTTIAHSYASMECRMDSLLTLRKQFKDEGVNVSVNDLIIKAVAVALSRCPEMNCVWQGDQLKVGGPVDISVAVATPAGLITPIVRGADSRGLEDIAATVRDLATRAKENKLKLDEFQGGTFTISNLGMFGIREFSAIINPPQCGILAVGGTRLVPDESGAPVPLMTSQLSFDRSAVDDFQAAEFLDTLKAIMENPKTILLGSYTADVPHPLAALL